MQSNTNAAQEAHNFWTKSEEDNHKDFEGSNRGPIPAAQVYSYVEMAKERHKRLHKRLGGMSKKRESLNYQDQVGLDILQARYVEIERVRTELRDSKELEQLVASGWTAETTPDMRTKFIFLRDTGYWVEEVLNALEEGVPFVLERAIPMKTEQLPISLPRSNSVLSEEDLSRIERWKVDVPDPKRSRSGSPRL